MMNDVQARVLQVITASGASKNVRRYFAPAAEGEGTFTGRLFERFGDGGDGTEVAHRFTAEDLVAVESLSVRVPPEAAYEILHGTLAPQLAKLLVGIPTDIDLGTSGATAVVEDGSAADRAWRLLKRQHGVGWVTAGKLMARKRPRLVPVYDEVVACVLGEPKSFWLTLDEALADDGLREKINNLRPATAPHVSTLRLLDVAIWMSHQDDHRKGNCAHPMSTNRE